MSDPLALGSFPPTPQTAPLTTTPSAALPVPARLPTRRVAPPGRCALSAAHGAAGSAAAPGAAARPGHGLPEEPGAGGWVCGGGGGGGGGRVGGGGGQEAGVRRAGAPDASWLVEWIAAGHGANPPRSSCSSAFLQLRLSPPPPTSHAASSTSHIAPSMPRMPPPTGAAAAGYAGGDAALAGRRPALQRRARQDAARPAALRLRRIHGQPGRGAVRCGRWGEGGVSEGVGGCSGCRGVHDGGCRGRTGAQGVLASIPPTPPPPPPPTTTELPCRRRCRRRRHCCCRCCCASASPSSTRCRARPGASWT